MQLLEAAKKYGFDTVVPLNPALLEAREDIRAMCSSDRCRIYGKNWSCPPFCGTVDQCQEKMHRYGKGILLQTLGHTEKTIDSKCYRETEKRHMASFYAFAELVKTVDPNALCLGAGGCRICNSCAYPQPCRFPEKAVSSMEGYGLFVTQVCRDCNVAYYYGERTITYTACVLYSSEPAPHSP